MGQTHLPDFDGYGVLNFGSTDGAGDSIPSGGEAPAGKSAFPSPGGSIKGLIGGGAWR